jgi:HEAT repeat protein
VFRAPSLPRTLAAALRDVGSAVAATRASAIRDLVEHVDAERKRVVAALERALSDEAPEVRAAAAVALADVRGAEALPALLFAVEDDDAHVRQMAISALGEIGDPRAGERLRRALSDARPEMRFQAIIAFARVASADEAIDAIVAATGDADTNIRYIAIRCAEEWSLGAARAMPPAVLDRAASLAADADASVRVAAAIVLARSGDRRGEPILLDVVRRRIVTNEAEDEAAAVELSGELGLEEALPHLERRAFGFLGFGEDKFAWQALVSLARMGHARARAKIVRDLGSFFRDRRTLAVAAVGRARLAEAKHLVEAMRGDESRADAEAVALTLEQLGARGASPDRGRPVEDFAP